MVLGVELEAVLGVILVVVMGVLLGVVLEGVLVEIPESPIIPLNIARIANAVQCQSLLSGNKDCNEFSFSIGRIVISVSNVSSH